MRQIERRKIAAVLGGFAAACAAAVASQSPAGPVPSQSPEQLPHHITIDASSIGLEGGLDLVRTQGPDRATAVRVFVVGPDGVQRPYDGPSIAVYRGHVSGVPGSSAVLFAGRTMSAGWIRFPDGRLMPIGDAPRAVVDVAGRPPVPMCAVTELPVVRRGDDPPAVGDGPSDTMRVRVAVETDYEYRSLFDSVAAAVEYASFVYAGVDEVFRRDMNARTPMTFLRIWDTEDDLFNEPDPLTSLQSWWNANMTDVERDAVQFFSGRRDLPYGGIAFLSSLCSGGHYSVVGYAMGASGDLSVPSAFNYDVHVTTHELGHNFGTLHTHSYGIDDCINLQNTPVRGGIMSYCSQTVSGGNAVTDLRFHTVCQSEMRQHLAEVQDCLGRDCNGNAVADAEDIAGGLSLDVNADGVPDECQDCNANGVLDPNDILGGGSADVDENGVPDECQRDCNLNGVPDVLDIREGTSHDRWGDGVPDECETDCDGNGISDYSQVQEDMTLDLDRDLVLDECADCDLDGVSDVLELDGGWGAWVASLTDGRVHQLHPVVGTVTRVGGVEGIASLSWDLVVVSGRRLVVSIPMSDALRVFDDRGDLLAEWSAEGAMRSPRGMAIHNGRLLVCSGGTGSVVGFDLASGQFLGDIVEAGAGGLGVPIGIHARSDGTLLVADSANSIHMFDGETGGSLGVLVSSESSGGLDGPRGIASTIDGRLLVASYYSNQVLSYDSMTGEFLGQFNDGGTDVALTMDQPWGVRRGPHGGIYVVRANTQPEEAHDHGELEHSFEGHHRHVSDAYLGTAELHINSTRVYIFDEATGRFLRSYVTGNDTGIFRPSGIDFMPGHPSDCNGNDVADDCDITSGFSEDADGNGVPDECGPGPCVSDLSLDGVVGTDDLLVVLGAWGTCAGCGADFDHDGLVDADDLLQIVDRWGSCP